MESSEERGIAVMGAGFEEVLPARDGHEDSLLREWEAADCFTVGSHMT